jgi:site-specific recombinase XerD
LAYFIGMRSPEYLDWCSQVRSIPFKKATRVLIGYLDKPEVEALLRAPDCSTRQGARNYALLLFLYNSGARADEAASLRVSNLQLGTSPSVRILGKGNKWRVCPLWPITVTTLRALITYKGTDEHVFLGRTREPMTRFGVYRIVRVYATEVSKHLESMQKKHVSPHTMRHTTAVHLLRAGVDINTIRAWLGHVSLDTTHVYAEVDLDMKAKALASVDITDPPTVRTKSSEKSTTVMNFMRQL